MFRSPYSLALALAPLGSDLVLTVTPLSFFSEDSHSSVTGCAKAFFFNSRSTGFKRTALNFWLSALVGRFTRPSEISSLPGH
jgi:hypothetical protein